MTHRISKRVRAFLPVTEVKGLKDGMATQRGATTDSDAPTLRGPYVALRIFLSLCSACRLGDRGGVRPENPIC